jgi:hypothetical protein
MTLSRNQDSTRISFHPESESAKASHHLIYFITGNPGLIAYYNTFLTTLHKLLLETFKASSDVLHIHGQSLAGFEDNSSHSRLHPYSLEEQITYSLLALTAQSVPSGPLKGKPYTSIILIGHSVGSYMLLEIIQRLKRSSSPVRIRAGILLFPTVTHIAASPSGVKISTLFRIPDFARRASFVAKGLTSLAPRSVLRWLVGVVTSMPSDSAEVTTRFLTSRMGIWQALSVSVTIISPKL